MGNDVEQDPEQPRPAVCARREAMKRFQRLEVRLLDRIFGLRPVPQDRCRGAVQIIHVREGFRLEFLDSCAARMRAFRSVEATAA